MAGYDTDFPGLLHGSYGVSYPLGPFPVTGPVEITFTDSTRTECIRRITVYPVRVLELGRLIAGQSIRTVFSEPSGVTPPMWVAGQDPFTAVQNGLYSGEALASETLDLSTITGPVNFTARLVAFESDDGSNFESDDLFRIRLELTGPNMPPSVPLLTRVMDEGTVLPSGYLNGYTGLNEADYMNNVVRDEFNATGAGWRGSSGKTFDFFYRIPDGATSARVVITGGNDSSDEFFTVSNLTFSTGPVGFADGDGDGQSDRSEAMAGTNPVDPNDCLRLTNVVRNGTGLRATFHSKARVNYHPEFSTALNSGWTSFGPVIGGTGAGLTVSGPDSSPPGGGKYFLRVSVVP